MDIPDNLRRKIANLDPEAQARVRDRVRRRSLHMSSKLRREMNFVAGMSGLGEDAVPEFEVAAKLREVLLNAPPTEMYDRTSLPVVPPEVDLIPKTIDDVPRVASKLVNLPSDLHEGVRAELIDRYGVPADQADVIAGHAVDRWVEQADPEVDMTPAEAQVASRDTVPTFSVEALPVDNGLSGMAGLGEEAVVLAPASMDTSVFSNWKKIVPLALGAGILVLWLRKR